MQKNNLNLFFIILALFIITTSLLIWILHPSSNTQQIAQIQQQLNNFLTTNPKFYETGCELQDQGSQIVLLCQTSGTAQSTSSGPGPTVYVTFSPAGMQTCINNRCTFTPHPTMPPIPKPKDLTFVNEGPSYSFPGCQHTAISQEEEKSFYKIVPLTIAKTFYQTLNEERCSHYTTSIVKNTCLLCIAETQHTETSCNKITYETLTGDNLRIVEPYPSLKDDCIAELGIYKKDLNYCNQLPTQSQQVKDYCLLQFAESKQDPSSCPFIQNPNTKEACTWYARGLAPPNSVMNQLIKDQF